MLILYGIFAILGALYLSWLAIYYFRGWQEVTLELICIKRRNKKLEDLLKLSQVRTRKIKQIVNSKQEK